MLTAIELIRATIDGMTERAHPMHMRGLPFQVVEIDGDHWGRRRFNRTLKEQIIHGRHEIE